MPAHCLEYMVPDQGGCSAVMVSRVKRAPDHDKVHFRDDDGGLAAASQHLVTAVAVAPDLHAVAVGIVVRFARFCREIRGGNQHGGGFVNQSRVQQLFSLPGTPLQVEKCKFAQIIRRRYGRRAVQVGFYEIIRMTVRLLRRPGGIGGFLTVEDVCVEIIEKPGLQIMDEVGTGGLGNQPDKKLGHRIYIVETASRHIIHGQAEENLLQCHAFGIEGKTEILAALV